MIRITLEAADGRRWTQRGTNLFHGLDCNEPLTAYWINGRRTAFPQPFIPESSEAMLDLGLIRKALKDGAPRHEPRHA